MANINKELNQIKNAVYGKDVRQAIHDGIEKAYNDATSGGAGDTNLEVVLARGNYDSLNKRLDASDSQLAETEQELDDVSIRLNDKRDKAQQVDLDEMTPRTLTAIQNKEGETTFNLLSIPRPHSVDRYKFSKSRLSANLFDKDTALIGKLVSNQDGQESDNAAYISSDFIPITSSVNYASKSIRSIAYYDHEKNFISGESPFVANHIKQTFTPPANAEYVRFSWYGTAAEDGLQEKVFARESEWKWGYIPYTFELRDLQIKKENLRELGVLQHIKQSINLFNPHTVNRGKDVSRSQGILADNPERNTSDFIKVVPDTSYFIARVLNCVFYDSQQVRVSALDLSSQPTNQVVTIPSNVHYIRISFYSGEETIFETQMVTQGSRIHESFIPYGFYLDDLRISEKNLDFDISEIAPQPKQQIRKEGIRWAAGYYWSDLTFVGNELWAFGPSDDAQAISEGVGALYIFEDNDALTYKKTLYHDFGHVNTINYCEETDSLIFGNGSGQYGTDGEMYVIEGVKHWKDFSKETMIELENLPIGSRLVKFEFGRDFGDKVNVYWGENNLGQHNICYVASNDAANFSRLLLGKGTNQFSEGNFISGLSEGKFNGTYEILKEWSTDSLEVIQGARYYNGYHYLGLGHHGLWLEKYKLHEDGSVTSEGKREMAYKEDGSNYDFYASEGVDIREGMIYHSTFGNSGTKAIHKYRVF